MKIPEILHCSVCNQPLNQFELGKWNRLVEYWGGKIGNRTPKCRDCYNEMIKKAQERSTL